MDDAEAKVYAFGLLDRVTARFNNEQRVLLQLNASERAMTHKLWVKTAQLTASWRPAKPLLRSGWPRKLFFTMPIRPSHCERRHCSRLNFQELFRRWSSFTERGQMPL